ncbi:hypothetical protein MBLNU459_g7547t1 [Dothideomycetes sp. NU459]
MDKLKKIFSPGHSHDDETLYGSGNQAQSQSQSHTTGKTTGEESYLNSDPLYANSADAGVKRQILNPGNEKYDETSFGDHHSTDPSSTLGSRPTATGTASTASIRSGVVGAEQPPPSATTDSRSADYSTGNTGASNTSGLTDRTATGTHDSHLGRDAALAGGAGATGLGAHEASKHHHDSTTGALGSNHGTTTDASQSSTGRSFPLSGSNTATGSTGATHTGLGNPTGTQGSHLGRDAALAGGVGAGAYEADKHHHGHHGHHDQTGSGSSLTGNNTGLGNTSTVGNTSGTQGSHLGRDAALAGGVGAGAYEADKHHHHHGQTGTGSTLTGGNTGTGSATGTHNSHLGRDAALAGGVGAGAHEADKHHHHHGQTGTGSTLTGGNTNTGTTGGILSDHQHKGHGHKFEGPAIESAVPGAPHHFDGPHATDTANRLDPHVSGGLASGTGSDRHHLGRDAAVGGAGAAGLGAYEAEKHHHHHDPTTSSTSTSQPLGGSSSTHQGQHHLGRDAGLAGGAGALGAGAYEAEKHHNTSSGLTGTHGTSSGLTGNQGTSSGLTGNHGTSTALTGNEQPREHHLGRDAALAGGAGAAGLGAHEAGKHHHQHHEAPLSGSGGFDDQRYDPSATSGTSHGLRSGEHASSTGYPSSTSNTTGTSTGTSHTGRDAALAGGAGAAGLAGYEASRGHTGGHHNDTLNKVDPRINPQAADSQKQHHYGRDAALAGGAGAVGTGAYEAEKHHHQHGATGQNTSGYGSSNQPTSSQVNTHGATSGVAGVEQPREHHYGRDAAVAGGVGAAGAGAYEHESRKDEKVAEKAARKEEKREEKEEKKYEKEARKEEKREEKDEKKSGGGLLGGLLHHDKKDEHHVKSGLEYRDADQAAHLRHQQQLERDAAAGTAGSAGVAGARFEPSLREQDHHIGTDERGHNRLHKDPPAKVERELEARAREQGNSSGTVTEPHTGLPMNVGKYGSGAGGTDGGPISGYNGQ